MNREEYLKRLSFLLKDLPEEEIEDAIAYYEDYFEEAGEEKEEQVIKELGSPEKIARMIRDSVQGNQASIPSIPVSWNSRESSRPFP